MKRHGRLFLLALTALVFGLWSAQAEEARYLAGELHSHTLSSDGTQPLSTVVEQGLGVMGIDWMATSDHGGEAGKNVDGRAWSVVSPDKPMLGNPKETEAWRWQVLRDFLPAAADAEGAKYPGKILLAGFEWNVPAHDHAAVLMTGPDAWNRLARFEYLFDSRDSGTTGDAALGVSGKQKDNNHAKAVAGAQWLEANAKDNGIMVIHHPGRAVKYDVTAIRDLNNAAPDVLVAMEMQPGHQKSEARGEFDGETTKNSTAPDALKRLRTYGGVDYMLAEVGGLCDALWGEGRRISAATGADFHDASADYWPGEFSKTHVFTRDGDGDKKFSANELMQGFRSGNVWFAQGDLINALEATVRDSAGKTAAPGETLSIAKGDKATLNIRFKSPANNRHKNPTTGKLDTPRVDHVDVITGAVTGKRTPGTPEYAVDKNPTTRVITRLDAKNAADADGWKTLSFDLGAVNESVYLRLRGTDTAANQPGKTDADGNPMEEPVGMKNSEANAYACLWFYSNPVFIQVK